MSAGHYPPDWRQFKPEMSDEHLPQPELCQASPEEDYVMSAFRGLNDRDDRRRAWFEPALNHRNPSIPDGPYLGAPMWRPIPSGLGNAAWAASIVPRRREILAEGSEGRRVSSET